MGLHVQLQLQLYTAKSQYRLNKAGTSSEHWQFEANNSLMKVWWKQNNSLKTSIKKHKTCSVHLQMQVQLGHP